MSKPIPHGTVNGYKNYGCRCDECKQAKAAHRRKYYVPKPRQRKPIPHGTNSGYMYHKCRCPECRQAAYDYTMQRKLATGWVRKNRVSEPIDAEKYRGLVEEACKAFSLDPGYLYRMGHAAAKASSSLPQAQLR